MKNINTYANIILNYLVIIGSQLCYNSNTTENLLSTTEIEEWIDNKIIKFLLNIDEFSCDSSCIFQGIAYEKIQYSKGNKNVQFRILKHQNINS